jgi:glycosyltransferase involved in cell wall biosynthesis
MSSTTVENNRPRVSVCIPTVDRVDFLREAIASVAAQTWRDFEVVIADNSGNTEGQRQIDGVMAEFPQLRFVLKRHPQRLDAIENFNSLIDTAQCELWACLTDDDRIRPNFLARSVEALDRHPECAFTFADHWIIHADGTVDEPLSKKNSIKFGRSRLQEGVYLHHQLFELFLKQAMCLQTGVFRRPAIASLRFVPGILAADYLLFLRLSAGTNQFNAYYVDERLFEYRLHSLQITSTMDRKTLFRDQIAACENVPEIPARYARAFNKKLSRTYLALALMEAEEGDSATARTDIGKSLGLSLSLGNALGGLLVTTAPFAIKGLRKLRGSLARVPYFGSR